MNPQVLALSQAIDRLVNTESLRVSDYLPTTEGIGLPHEVIRDVCGTLHTGHGRHWEAHREATGEAVAGYVATIFDVPIT